RNSVSLFTNGGLDEIRGLNTALLDGQQSVEILMEHHLQGNMNRYPLIVIPGWDYLLPSFRDDLLVYVKNGGMLLVIGADACKLFEHESGVEFKDQTDRATKWLGFSGNMAAVEGRVQKVVLPKDVKTIGGIYDAQDFRFSSMPAAATLNCGKGQIGFVFMDMGKNYENNQSTVERDFLNAVVKELFQHPAVEVKGSHLVHVIVNTLNRKMIVHLINTGGQHASKNVYAYDEVPAVGPLTVTIRTAKPSRVVLEPEHKPLPFTFANGIVNVKLQQLSIHSMIVLE
ncbi:MAG: hypothetical protein ABUT20_62815, partial [Bacteroidota bacterium]